MSSDINDQLVLVAGESATGKSASLRNIKNQADWMYLNTEAGKRLPFKNNFDAYKITDPLQVLEAFDHATNDAPQTKGIILDTLTFLMDQYESQYVLGAANTMTAWGAYQQFFKEIMQEKVPKFGKPVLIMAHTREDLDERSATMKSSVPIKGALKNNGIEAYFSTVVATKKVSIKDLKGYDNDMLSITEQDELLGFKHVFQTQLTKQTVGERIRSPMGMFTREQTYINNDCQLLLDHLNDYYA